MSVTRAVGLDGCPGGWAAVLLTDGRFSAAAVVGSARDAVDELAPDIMGVDIPIGLVDGADREADLAARRFLGRAGSSVFNAPARSVVLGYRSGTVATYADALELSRRMAGKGLSQQTWRLVPSVAEIDELAYGVELPVLEAHPEVCFRLLAGGRLASKRSWNGHAERRRLLAGHGIELPDHVPGGERCAPDDLVDAAVAAWTAARLAGGAEPVRFPAASPQLDRGRRVEIVAAR